MPVKNVRITMASMRKKVSNTIKAGILSTVEQMKEELVLATPVDTGEAREGWQIQEVEGARYPTYEVINDVPHIGALNEGHSDQAPARFIEAVALRYGDAVGQVVTYKDK